MGGGGTTIQAPPAPQYNESMRSILQAQVDLAPQVYASEQKYQPLYNQLQIQQQSAAAQAALDQAKTLYPQVAAIEGQYTAANRANELQQLQTALPQYQQAFNALTPGYAQAVATTGQLAQQAMNKSLEQPQLSAYEKAVGGPDFGKYVSNVPAPQYGQYLGGIRGPQMNSGLNRINTGLVNQYVGQMPGMQQYGQFLAANAANELAAGRSLTPEEQRQADQAARSAYAARGTALGNQAVNAEILNRSEVANQRYQQRLANAANAAQQIQGIYTPALQSAQERQMAGAQYGLGAQQQAYQQAMGKEQLAAATQEAAYNQAMGLEQGTSGAQQAAFQQALQRNQAQQQALQFGQQLQAGYAQLGAGAMGQLQQAQAPILQAFYNQPILQNQAGQAQQMGMAMQQQAGPQYFNPESQTGMGSIYGAYNAQTQLAAANAQAKASAKSGTSQMLGSLGGAAIGAVAIF